MATLPELGGRILELVIKGSGSAPVQVCCKRKKKRGERRPGLPS